MTKEKIAQLFQELQSDIIAALEKTDGAGVFISDNWVRAEGGGGKTCVMQHGNIIEKGGVNFSAVYGPLSNEVSTMMHVTPGDFYATGVSIVIHPHNPFVPIIHMNVRYFEMSSGEYWFGGGIDLTPHYIQENQAQTFHKHLKDVCDKHHPEFYTQYKEWADRYFFIPHRNETRGIGGIFFDRLNEKSVGRSKEEIHAFVMDIGRSFAPIYTQFMRDNFNKPFSEQNKRWQLLRRGRYVEFNLVYDKGTRFGLETGGRIESILMSLPQLASWEYAVEFDEESAEAHTLNLLKKGVDWV
jgi:coproporphyrinogen III oxidase